MARRQTRRESPGEAPGPRGMSWPFFFVGIFLVLVTTGLAIAGFVIATLTKDQRGILIFWFSLTAGFSAGCFVGSLSVKTQGWIKGLFLSATGGFAVWLLTFFFAAPKLFPETPTNQVPIHPIVTPTDKVVAITSGEVPRGMPIHLTLENLPQFANVTWSSGRLGEVKRLTADTATYLADRIGAELVTATVESDGNSNGYSFEFRVVEPLTFKWRWLTKPIDQQSDRSNVTSIEQLGYRFPTGELLIHNPFPHPITLDSFEIDRPKFTVDEQPLVFFQLMPLLDTVVVTATNTGWGPYHGNDFRLFSRFCNVGDLSAYTPPKYDPDFDGPSVPAPAPSPTEPPATPSGQPPGDRGLQPIEANNGGNNVEHVEQPSLLANLDIQTPVLSPVTVPGDTRPGAAHSTFLIYHIGTKAIPFLFRQHSPIEFVSRPNILSLPHNSIYCEDSIGSSRANAFQLPQFSSFSR